MGFKEKLQAKKWRQERVIVSDCDEELYVAELSAKDLQAALDRQKSGNILNSAHVAIAALRDKDGNRIFTEADFDLVSEKLTVKQLIEIQNATMKMNGIDADSQDKAEKN